MVLLCLPPNEKGMAKTINFFIAILALLLLIPISCTTAPEPTEDSLPTFLIGAFEDDYGVQYHIDQEVFHLLPDDRYHILSVHRAEGYIILQNDSLNSFASGLFTRIDYQKLEDMEPYEWAFCFSSYDAASIEEATNQINTQKTDLKTGCDGFPFSRMKRLGVSE
jgi:hypothetical protein